MLDRAIQFIRDAAMRCLLGAAGIAYLSRPRP